MMKSITTIIILLVLTAPLLAAEKEKVNEVASKLACYCGSCPRLVVTACGCGTAEQIKLDIAKMLDSGMTQQQIVARYVKEYGETVLAAPPQKGFNLTVWLMPFLGFAAGAMILFVFLKKQKRATTENTVSELTPLTDSDRERLYRELEQRR